MYQALFFAFSLKKKKKKTPDRRLATLLRTNSSQFTFEENMSNLKPRLQNRDYLARVAEKHFSETKFFD